MRNNFLARPVWIEVAVEIFQVKLAENLSEKNCNQQFCIKKQKKPHTDIGWFILLMKLAIVGQKNTIISIIAHWPHWKGCSKSEQPLYATCWLSSGHLTAERCCEQNVSDLTSGATRTSSCSGEAPGSACKREELGQGHPVPYWNNI